ncbi:hypothetical protein SLEP1_g49438 [Rubroshorea leprosula]|uniref:Uncharacterized protein n=1 Tax=Rubroshorea leprosula TaxID=152421 RepID=A0AAV5LWT5_9ROSI|nr:hypothetical protein SLEP1_g49438 [Rubroshorea leprosula]
MSRPISELPPFKASDFKLVQRESSAKKSVDTAITEKVIVGKEKGRKAVEKVSFDSNDSSSNESSDNEASSKCENGFERGGKDEGFYGNIDINRVASEEFELDVGDAAKRYVSSKNKMDVDKPTMSAAKKVVSSNKAGHTGQPSSIPTKSSEAVDFTTRLLKNLAKAYLSKVEFGMARDDTIRNLDEPIKEQAKHVEEIKKSLVETKELVLKLEEGLMLAKAYLELLNQEKEHLSSNNVTELR